MGQVHVGGDGVEAAQLVPQRRHVQLHLPRPAKLTYRAVTALLGWSRAVHDAAGTRAPRAGQADEAPTSGRRSVYRKP